MTEAIHIGNPLLWGGFFLFVIIMLALDLFVFGGRKAHKVSVKEAAAWSIAWFLLALAFNGLLWWYLKGQFGAEVAANKSLEFLTGYIIEKSLSIDNIFVFLMIFTAFKVPIEFQRRVLVYGVFGAIVLRLVMIVMGAYLVQQFSWVLYIFGAFLVFTGIKMLMPEAEAKDLENNWVLKFARSKWRVTDGFVGERFVVKRDGLVYITPLLLVLILVELSDVVFAVDSIPAIFAITTDPFIVATSNIFAIMGLRALYFLLMDMADRFHLIKYGLAVVLTFIGVKLIIIPWFHMPVAVSLSVVVLVLALSVVASIWVTRNTAKH